MNRLTEVMKAAKFAVVGVANTLIDYGVFALLVQLLSLNVFLSQVISYSCGILNSYIFNRSWTFRSQNKFFGPALVRFLVLNLCMLGVSTGLLAVLLQLGLSKLTAKACTVAVTMVVGFVVNRLWVFRPQSSAEQA